MTAPRPPRPVPPATPSPARVCAGCGGVGPQGSPICGRCRRTLQHVCYGKTRMGKPSATGTAATWAHQGAVPYPCPVCRTQHVGTDSPLGRAVHADAALICLRLHRQAPTFLAGLASAWAPPVADRAAWRAAVTARRHGGTPEPARAARARTPLPEVPA